MKKLKRRKIKNISKINDVLMDKIITKINSLTDMH